MNKNKLRINIIAEAGILIALAVVLDYICKLIPFLNMPQGGHITLAMFPLVILSLRRGVSIGIISGLIYGMLNWVFDGYILHPGSIFLDYLIAFGAYGVVGVVSNLYLDKEKKNTAIIVLFIFIAGLIRYISSSLSGAIFFKEYAGNLNPYFYSFIVYNLPYMAITTIITMLLYPLLEKRLKEIPLN